ncbi:hypothetical protein BDK89_0650 [Ilumatobacter fluminis]|uniref:Uncharacterized protein n=1 Tax=Ilumatobacter fluminis TaxID=467091 RepID=A0A4R7HWA2_9ACTN|nr:hypothetical protein [Ilumatobacter fluminis]TDT15090.1 hypothetical protein BDK89_0650 [Ilumatobacter fluminis]
MTDPWARPSDDGARARRPPAQSVEIELDGPDGPTGDPGERIDSGEPNWRAVSGIAAVLGVVLGLLVAGVIFWSGGDDGDEGEPSSSTLPIDELTAEITVPPTLPPVETAPPTTIAGLERMAPEPRPVTVPTYPPSSGAVADWDTAVEFDTLANSIVAELVADSSAGDGPSSGQAIWDSTSRRFELRLDFPIGTSRTIYDTVTETVYETVERPRSGAATWTSRAGDDYFPPSFDPMEYFSELVLGPVRADNADLATDVTTDRNVVSVRAVPTVRTTYRLPMFTLGAWAGDGDEPVDVDVFVDEGGRVVRSQFTYVNPTATLVQVHSPTRVDVSVELPSDADIEQASSDAVTAESLRPVYETIEPVPANSTGQYSISAALDQRDESPPAAAAIDVSWAGNTARFTAQRDDGNDRRLLTQTFDAVSTVSVQIDDAATATTYVTDDVEGVWTRLTSTGPGGRLPPVDERMISGLVPRAALEDAEVLEFYRYVVLRDGTIALEAHLEVAPGEIVLPSRVPMTLDPTEPVEVYLYVGSGVVHELHIVGNQGEPQALVQWFDLRAAPDITLPDDDRVVDG